MVADEFGLQWGVTVPTPVDLERFQEHDPDPIRVRYASEGQELLLYVGCLAKEK